MTAGHNLALHSMTKPITSLGAMMLIDAGKLSLADPVAKYIPSFGNMMGGGWNGWTRRANRYWSSFRPSGN